MSAYIDNPLTFPEIQWVVDAPYRPEKLFQSSLISQTGFASKSVVPSDFFGNKAGPDAPTFTVSENINFGKGYSSPQTQLDSSKKSLAGENVAWMCNDIERIASQRVKLIAEKYARDNVPQEILARLEILNHRLSKFSPRVTDAQVKALEIANDHLINLDDAHDEIAHRLGISI